MSIICPDESRLTELGMYKSAALISLLRKKHVHVPYIEQYYHCDISTRPRNSMERKKNELKKNLFDSLRKIRLDYRPHPSGGRIIPEYFNIINQFAVSNIGNIYDIRTGEKMKQEINKNGFTYVTLKDVFGDDNQPIRVFVQDLVILAFIFTRDVTNNFHLFNCGEYEYYNTYHLHNYNKLHYNSLYIYEDDEHPIFCAIHKNYDKQNNSISNIKLCKRSTYYKKCGWKDMKTYLEQDSDSESESGQDSDSEPTPKPEPDLKLEATPISYELDES